MVDLRTLEALLAGREADVPALRDGCQKQVLWGSTPAQKTDVAVVFIHGFSASCGELRPMPDKVAAALGANLFFTRLTGHGQDSDAMGKATLAAWQADVSEALEIGATLGDRILVIGCSTGCTLSTLAMANGARVAGMVQVSPNYGLAHKAAQILLDLPMSEKWGHLIAGKTRSFPVLSDDHARYWTTSYPSIAAHPMAQAVRAVRSANLGAIKDPTLVLFNPADQVVSAAATKATLARWGGPVTRHSLTQTPDDDTMGHIMAGDVFSPGQTDPMVARILEWFATI